MSRIDVRIHGSGIVGRALALSLARQGLAVGIDAKPVVAPGGEQRADVRAYALNAASVELPALFLESRSEPSGCFSMPIHGVSSR